MIKNTDWSDIVWVFIMVTTGGRSHPELSYPSISDICFEDECVHLWKALSILSSIL